MTIDEDIILRQIKTIEGMRQRFKDCSRKLTERQRLVERMAVMITVRDQKIAHLQLSLKYAAKELQEVMRCN